MADKYNQTWVMRLAQPGEKRWAITLFGTTYYSCPEEQVSERWRRHEECHKLQQKRDGLRFYPRYLHYSRKYGYHDNPYEVEARAAEEACL
jgi:hypothetical protein